MFVAAIDLIIGSLLIQDLTWDIIGRRIAISGVAYDLWLFSSGYIWYKVVNYFRQKEDWFEEKDDIFEEVQDALEGIIAAFKEEVRGELQYLNPTGAVDLGIVFLSAGFLITVHFLIYIYYIVNPAPPFFEMIFYEQNTVHLPPEADVLFVTVAATYFPPAVGVACNWVLGINNE